jgi:hypothetical protein
MCGDLYAAGVFYIAETPDAETADANVQEPPGELN